MAKQNGSSTWYNPTTWDVFSNNNSKSNGTSRQGRANDRSRQNNNNYGNSGRPRQNNYSGNRQNNGRNTSNNSNYYNNYNPYANNDRQNSHCHGHSHQYQAQSQTYVQNKKQQIAQTQTFLEQVDNTVLTISLAGKGYNDGQDEDTVDLLCDSAIISLNMFAVSCEQLHQEKDQDALDLGRKRVHDKFAELKSKNKPVYDIVEPHRNFINAALNGQKNLRYKEDRVEPGVKELFERDPAEINKAYAHMIHQQQKFDKAREAMLEEKTNQKLAKQQQSELNEYRRNEKKYGRNNKRSKNKSGSGSGSGSKYNRAKVTDLYFTKNGKSAKFVDVEAVERAKKAQQAMDEDMFGSDDVYDEILPKLRFKNAALKLSKQNKWNGISKPIPCQILAPNKKERADQDKSTIVIRPCYPWNNCTLIVGKGALELDEDKIKKIEKKQIAMLENFETNIFNQNLGYKTIEEQEQELNEQIKNINIYDDSNDDEDMDGESDSNI